MNHQRAHLRELDALRGFVAKNTEHLLGIIHATGAKALREEAHGTRPALASRSKLSAQIVLVVDRRRFRTHDLMRLANAATANKHERRIAGALALLAPPFTLLA